jgi:hypothetical protein
VYLISIDPSKLYADADVLSNQWALNLCVDYFTITDPSNDLTSLSELPIKEKAMPSGRREESKWKKLLTVVGLTAFDYLTV